MIHHLIFEGAELAGKSWLMSQVYNHLEPKYNQSGQVLDGCHWFNADVGVFGTAQGKEVIAGYLQIFQALAKSNILAEKLHISDAIYNKLFHDKTVSYNDIEERLHAMDFKIILITFPENKEILKKRIQDRLNLYPHYARIMHEPEWYIEQQRMYRQYCQNSQLPVLEVSTVTLPDESRVQEILDWIGEV